MILDYLDELGFSKKEIKNFEEKANDFDYQFINQKCNKCALWTLKRDIFGYDKKIKNYENLVIERVNKVINKK